VEEGGVNIYPDAGKRKDAITYGNNARNEKGYGGPH
jgi:hypothetical protein